MWRDDFDMDLPNSIIGFHRIVGPLADIKLYSRGSYNIDGFLIDLSYWNTDKGVAAYFGMLKAGESLDDNPEGPQPEDYITEDEAVIVSFDEALRIPLSFHSSPASRLYYDLGCAQDTAELRCDPASAARLGADRRE